MDVAEARRHALDNATLCVPACRLNGDMAFQVMTNPFFSVSLSLSFPRGYSSTAQEHIP